MVWVRLWARRGALSTLDVYKSHRCATVVQMAAVSSLQRPGLPGDAHAVVSCCGPRVRPWKPGSGGTGSSSRGERDFQGRTCKRLRPANRALRPLAGVEGTGAVAGPLDVTCRMPSTSPLTEWLARSFSLGLRSRPPFLPPSHSRKRVPLRTSLPRHALSLLSPTKSLLVPFLSPPRDSPTHQQSCTEVTPSDSPALQMRPTLPTQLLLLRAQSQSSSAIRSEVLFERAPLVLLHQTWPSVSPSS